MPLQLKKLNQCFLVTCLLLSSCKVMLVGAYDPITDQSIQKIQNDVSTLIVKIEKNFDVNDTLANKYNNFKNDYSSIEGEIASLRIRCNSLPKYKTISTQVNALDSSITLFEKAHQLGFASKSEVEIDKKTFEFDFAMMVTSQNALKSEKN